MDQVWTRLRQPSAVVALCVLLLAFFLSPELPPAGVWCNDLAFHVALVRGLEQHHTMDFWFHNDLGYPFLRLYQPLWHLAIALLDGLTLGYVGVPWLVQGSIFALALAFPLGVYLGVRRWLLFEELPEEDAAWAAAAAALLASLSTSFTGHGFDPLQSIAVRGGLICRSWALVFFLPAFAWSYGWVSGKTRTPWPALALAFTCAGSSLVYAIQLVAAVSVRFLLSLLFHPEGPRLRRAGLWFVGFIGATAFLWWPMVADNPWVHHPKKSFDPWINEGFGLGTAFGHLASGRLLDGASAEERGRLPVMTLLAVVGAASLLARWRERRELSAFLVGSCALSFSFFVGRDAWGGILYALPLLRSYQWGRFEMLVQLWAAVVAGLGLATGARRWWPRSRCGGLALGAAALATVVALAEGPAQHSSKDRAFLDAVRASPSAALVRDLVARAGDDGTRVCVGGPTTWEDQLHCARTRLGVALTAEGVPTVGKIFQGMNIAAMTMLPYDPLSTWQGGLLGVGSFLAPLPLLRLFPLREPPVEVAPGIGFALARVAPPLGYFSRLAIEAPRTITVDHVDSLLVRALREPDRDVFLPFRLGSRVDLAGGAVTPQPLSPLMATGTRFLPVPGGGHESRLRVEAPEAGAVVFPVPFHPNLTAAVDGAPVAPRPVIPGFAAVPVSPGSHEVVLRYRSSRVKDALCALAGLVLALGLRAHRRLTN